MNFLSQSWLLDRRHALRAMGTCISLPMLECVTPLRAAEQTVMPKLCCFIYLANSVHSLKYQITKPGKDYEFSRSLKPLEKHREFMTPSSGLHHPGALGHDHSCISVWLTGGKLGPTDCNTIPVDQRIAEITAADTLYPSMDLALTGASLAWTADGVRLPPMGRCREFLASMFEEPKGGKEVQRRSLRRKGSVLDANLDEVRQLDKSLGMEDKGRMEQYLTSVREAELRTRRADAWLDTPLPAISDADRKRTNRDIAATMRGDYFRTAYDLMVLAFQTVVGLTLSGKAQKPMKSTCLQRVRPPFGEALSAPSYFGFFACVFALWLLCAVVVFADEPFRPRAGEFPPLEQAKAYDGQLVFVDHANRRGSIRVTGGELFHSTAPQPFAMLPYGTARYHGAPADLRDIPLGTMLHGRFYLPPDPKLSSVPVIDHASLNPTAPAENHAILLEDEPSFCLREGKVWRLKEVEITGGKTGMIVAHRESSTGGEDREDEHRMSIDAATCFWRGREKLGLEDLITEGLWPAAGKKSLDGQIVHLSIAWKPAGHWERRVGNRMHIADVWLDETAMQRAARHQIEVHRELIRSRWMPAYVDGVEYGKFGSAAVTVTLFGGMDPSLYADFQTGINGQLAASEANLKHEYGTVRQSLVAISGPIQDVMKQDNDIPLGSSGIQIRIKVDQIIEGVRPGRIVRIRPMSWPDDAVPREEYTEGHLNERFPSPDIFPTYGRISLN